MGERCGTAVVTLGSCGCLALQGDAFVREVAVAGVPCVDSTGAGDLFAAGFTFGLLQDLSLLSCVRLGCLSGAAVVQNYGAEVSPAAWAWARSKLPQVQLARKATMPQPVVDAADAPASQSDSSYW